MTTKPSPVKFAPHKDRDAFMQSLALFETTSTPPTAAAAVLDDVDVDAFIESAFGNVTTPPR